MMNTMIYSTGRKIVIVFLSSSWYHDAIISLHEKEEALVVLFVGTANQQDHIITSVAASWWREDEEWLLLFSSIAELVFLLLDQQRVTFLLGMLIDDGFSVVFVDWFSRCSECCCADEKLFRQEDQFGDEEWRTDAEDAADHRLTLSTLKPLPRKEWLNYDWLIDDWLIAWSWRCKQVLLHFLLYRYHEHSIVVGKRGARE